MSMERYQLIQGDCLDVLRRMEIESVHCVVTSPPYFNLRDYQMPGQLGLEKLHDCAGWATGQKCGECFICRMTAVFSEVRRVLRDDGTCWVNIGDSYAGNRGYQVPDSRHKDVGNGIGAKVPTGLKPKDLMLIPQRLALSLQADGWYVRSEIIWCLSGGTWVYAKTQKGVMPMMIRDMTRLDPATVKLWNGEKWTQVLGWSKSPRKSDELELVLRSGERISCTPTHQFPTNRGLLQASDIRIGDRLQTTRLPEPEVVKDCAIGEDAAWFAGLYLAEGSMSGGDCIQIAGHADEEERWINVQRIAKLYGGTAIQKIEGNKRDIRVYGKILCAILSELVGGRTAKDKCFSPIVWRYSNKFIAAMVNGYLSGDGHFDEKNNRWRLGFCRNYNLERDLRTACARLGYRLCLNFNTVPYKGKQVPTFRGEIRFSRSGHHNEKDMGEVVEIRKARCREVYDIGVEDEPHLFALASGVLTHNSKRNPMPESVKDRPTKAHEQVWLLSKSPTYFYDADAIQETTVKRVGFEGSAKGYAVGDRNDGFRADYGNHVIGKRNRRTVWELSSEPYPGAHFATFPESLVEPCILAGCPVGGVVFDPFCGSGTTGAVALRLDRRFIGAELNPEYIKLAHKRIGAVACQEKLPLFGGDE